MGVAAVRRLANRVRRNPADPKVSHAQPPLNKNAGTKKAPAIEMGAPVRLLKLGSPNPVADFAATAKE